MIKSKEIRDEIIAFLKEKYTTASAEIDCHNFNACNIAILDTSGKPIVLRITIVKHN